MSRLKKKDKLIRLAGKQNLPGKTELLFMQLIHDTDSGILEPYQDYEVRYVNELFSGNHAAYYMSYVELLQKRLIVYNSGNDSLYIKPFSDSLYFNFLIGLKNQKRKYTREPERERNELINILMAGKYGKIISEALTRAQGDDIYYTSKACGFKVTDSLRPYLTGEPLSEKEINRLLQYNPDLLELEEKRRNLSKEEKRAYCACMAFADTNGIIEDYNIYSLVQSIQKEFGDKSFCTATMYLAIARLMELRLLSEIQEGNGSHSLKVMNYKESFERKEHYVIMHSVVLTRVFKKLEASALKLFFKFSFELNNGEDTGKKYTGQDKAIYFKIAKLSGQRDEARTKYDEQLLWLHKRYTGEMETLLMGEADSDFSALAEFFHFTRVNDTALQVRVRKEYFISKKAEKFKQLIALKGKYKKRAAAIEDTLKENEIEYGPEDLISMIRMFKNTNLKTIKTVMELVADRVREGRKKGWPDIEKLPAYIRTIYNEHINPEYRTLIPT